ncbi:hypothetical protein G3O08_18870 [Cryomorpha ignava]|uniref:Uncharacterized protein n=1 Tax=Cryomorpha ignava TaxID=101383 RepID=A0A7K3WV84_9FLAO|nr:hypothetical protein [Cryomorpha ignava]NEN25560.1 hypothetical protein [Cryomorpha ignava]
MRNPIHLERTRAIKSANLIMVSFFLIFSFGAFGQDKTPTKADIYEMIENKTPKRGIYKHYYEFLANAPSIIDSFYLKKSPRPYYLWQDTYSLEPRYVRKNKKVRRIWGFSDGEQAYIFDEGEFFPIVVEKGELVFYGFDRVDNTGVLATTLIVGAVGGGISAAGAQSNARSQKIGYTIHPVNGTPIHPHQPFHENREQKNELIVYRRSKKESDLPVKFLVDGDQLYSFEQKSYVLLQYPLSEGTITLCTGTDFKYCITVALNPDEPTYVKCTYPIDADSAKLILPTRSQGKYDFGKVENTQNKRGRQFPQDYTKE